jgi:hypothetical protein
MRTARVALAAFLVLGVLAAAGCKDTGDATSDLPRPSKAFCRAAGRYDERITSKKTPIATHIAMVEQIVAHAPADVKQDAETFLDALRRRAAGDTSVVDNPKVKRASDNVLRRAGQDCGWYQQKSSL